MNKKDKKKFKDLLKLLKEIEKEPIPNSYWKKESKMLQERIAESRRLDKLMKISLKDLQEEFDL